MAPGGPELEVERTKLRGLSPLDQPRSPEELRVRQMKARDMLRGGEVLRDHVAAVSCGVHNGLAVLDLDYAEDSSADTDANFVLTGTGGIVEIQATAERATFEEATFGSLLGLARKGTAELFAAQRAALDAA